MLRKSGADAIGMSTLPEVFAASAQGMSILALSVITNVLNENVIKPLSHTDVLRASRKASEQLKKVIYKLVSELN
jgi:purine-nucleoside phosphorylase